MRLFLFPVSSVLPQCFCAVFFCGDEGRKKKSLVSFSQMEKHTVSLQSEYMRFCVSEWFQRHDVCVCSLMQKWMWTRAWTWVTLTEQLGVQNWLIESANPFCIMLKIGHFVQASTKKGLFFFSFFICYFFATLKKYQYYFLYVCLFATTLAYNKHIFDINIMLSSSFDIIKNAFMCHLWRWF